MRNIHVYVRLVLSQSVHAFARSGRGFVLLDLGCVCVCAAQGVFSPRGLVRRLCEVRFGGGGGRGEVVEMAVIGRRIFDDYM